MFLLYTSTFRHLPSL